MVQAAPVTGNNAVAVRRSEIKQGVREVIMCKDSKGKLGLRLRAVNKGVFVQFVHTNSPAALAGLRFGDQILQIDGTTVAGFDSDKVMKILKKASPQRVVFAVRDRLVQYSKSGGRHMTDSSGGTPQKQRLTNVASKSRHFASAHQVLIYELKLLLNY